MKMSSELGLNSNLLKKMAGILAPISIAIPSSTSRVFDEIPENKLFRQSLLCSSVREITRPSPLSIGNNLSSIDSIVDSCSTSPSPSEASSVFDSSSISSGGDRSPCSPCSNDYGSSNTLGLFRSRVSSFCLDSGKSKTLPSLCKTDNTVRVREDLEKIRKNLKAKYAKKKTCWKLSVSEDVDNGTQQRTLCVETEKNKSRMIETECQSCHHVDRDFSNSLVMTSLEDGYFNAELALSKLPQGDIKIRVSGCQLHIFVYPENETCCKPKSTAKNDNPPTYCGRVSVPIYVVPETLTVSLSESRSSLEVRAMMKGYQYQRNISPNGDTRSRSCSAVQEKTTKPSKMKALVCSLRGKKFSMYCQNTMRDRAYTR